MINLHVVVRKCGQLREYSGLVENIIFIWKQKTWIEVPALPIDAMETGTIFLVHQTQYVDLEMRLEVCYQRHIECL